MRFTIRHIGLTGFWVLQGMVSFAAQAVIAAYFGTTAMLRFIPSGSHTPDNNLYDH